MTLRKFNYMGTENDDIAVLTSVLQKIDGRWMVVTWTKICWKEPI